METEKAIERLLGVSKSLKGLPLDRQQRICTRLDFLLQQVRSHHDRRAPEYDLKACWTLLHRDIAGSVLMEHRTAILSIMGFVGVRPVQTPKEERCANWDMERFFGVLADWVQKRSPLSEQNSKLLYFSLIALRDQAKQPKYQRNHQEISRSWKKVLELSKGTNLFEAYKGEANLRNSLQSFIGREGPQQISANTAAYEKKPTLVAKNKP